VPGGTSEATGTGLASSVHTGVSALRVTRLTVEATCVQVVLVVRPDVRRTCTVPREQLGTLFEALPGLCHHLCGNPAAMGFLEESFDTETAHLFEHVALELMVQAGSARDLKGMTLWDAGRDGRDVFRVSLEYDHDLVCLGALKLAVATLERVVSAVPIGDLSAELNRLRSLRMESLRGLASGVPRQRRMTDW